MLSQARRLVQASAAAAGARGYAQAPALTTPASSGGLFSSLFGSSGPTAPSMTVPLKDVPSFAFDSTKPAPTTQISTLSNGVKIAAQEAAVSAIEGKRTVIGAFVSSTCMCFRLARAGLGELLLTWPLC